jgi:hypothetical protein
MASPQRDFGEFERVEILRQSVDSLAGLAERRLHHNDEVRENLQDELRREFENYAVRGGALGLLQLSFGYN